MVTCFLLTLISCEVPGTCCSCLVKFETGATVGASDQWKLSQKLVVSMVKDQLKCDAPRLGIRSDVLDLPSTH